MIQIYLLNRYLDIEINTVLYTPGHNKTKLSKQIESIQFFSFTWSMSLKNVEAII